MPPTSPNAFSDLVVAFADPAAPTATRLGNPWVRAADGPGAVWTAEGAPRAVAASTTAGAGGWTVWAVGDVHAYRGASADPLARFASDLADGVADPGALDRHALVVGWCEDERRLHVWVDRLGTVHAYVGGSPGRLRLGTCFTAVAERSAGDLDWVGITGFCGLGFYPADRTPYEDVRILRPATHSVFDEAGRLVRSARWWEWSHDPAAASDDDLLDRFHDVWRTTVARQLGERRAVVPVSGGLDSRTVLAALVAADGSTLGSGVHAFTYGYSPGSVEIRIAREVARRRGLRADELVVRPYLLDRLDEVVGAVEGFQALSVSRQAGVSHELATMGDRVVGGHWGDVWFDTAGGVGARSTAPGDLVDVAFAKFAKRGREWPLAHLCRPHLGGRDPEDLLREVLRAELERLPDLGDPDLQLKVLKTEQWSFRWTLASTRAYHLARPTVLPFYGDDVVDLFLTIPSDRLAGRRLQIAYLRRHHPDLAGVRWQDTGTSLLDRAWEPPVALARRAAAKAIRTVRRRPVLQRNWEVQYRGDGRDERLGRLLEDGEAPGGRLAGPAGLAPLLERFRTSPDPATGYAVDVVATLAATVGRAG